MNDEKATLYGFIPKILLFLLIFLFLVFKINLIYSYLITSIISLGLVLYLKWHRAYSLETFLDKYCDPELYIEFLNELAEKNCDKQKQQILISIYRSRGYMYLGDNISAIDCLKEIEPILKRLNNKLYTIYVINLLLNYYALGEIEEAELLYEKKKSLLRLSESKSKLQVEFLMAERYYFLKEYNLSYTNFKRLHKKKLIKGQSLWILFRLAQMEIQNGMYDDAAAKLVMVVTQGKLMWIVDASNKLLKEIQERRSRNTYYVD